jgi:hypothetical protein
VNLHVFVLVTRRGILRDNSIWDYGHWKIWCREQVLTLHVASLDLVCEENEMFTLILQWCLWPFSSCLLPPIFLASSPCFSSFNALKSHEVVVISNVSSGSLWSSSRLDMFMSFVTTHCVSSQRLDRLWAFKREVFFILTSSQSLVENYQITMNSLRSWHFESSSTTKSKSTWCS